MASARVSLVVLALALVALTALPSTEAVVRQGAAWTLKPSTNYRTIVARRVALFATYNRLFGRKVTYVQFGVNDQAKARDYGKVLHGVYDFANWVEYTKYKTWEAKQAAYKAVQAELVARIRAVYQF